MGRSIYCFLNNRKKFNQDTLLTVICPKCSAPCRDVLAWSLEEGGKVSSLRWWPFSFTLNSPTHLSPTSFCHTHIPAPGDWTWGALSYLPIFISYLEVRFFSLAQAGFRLSMPLPQPPEQLRLQVFTTAPGFPVPKTFAKKINDWKEVRCRQRDSNLSV